MLRFFEGKSFQEIGAAFGASENAAKKRVAYALEKLRKYFSKRGVILPVAVIMAAISGNSVQAAPAVLAKTATALALAKGVTAAGSTLALSHGALKVMAWSNAKVALVTGAVLLLAVGGGTALYVAQQGPTTGGPVELKARWVVGKKYELHGEVDHSEATKSPDQSPPAQSGYKWTQDANISALKELPEGGWQLEWEFAREALEAPPGGQGGLSFDSAQSPAGNTNNPLTILGALIGWRLEYFTDAEGKVQRMEGVNQLTDHIAAVGTRQQRQIFSQLFGGDALKGYLSCGDWLPNRIMKVGESWSRKNDVADPIGMLTVSMKYKFNNWEQHGDHPCAHVLGTGNVTSKSVSTAAGRMVKIEEGKLSEEFWFDPELGMIADGRENQDFIFKITTRTQSVTGKMQAKSQWTLVGGQ